MPREELFVVSKVAAEHKTYESAAKSIDETLERSMHNQAMLLFHQYMLVGGMPMPVVAFIENKKDFTEVDKEKRDILKLYREDIHAFDENELLEDEVYKQILAGKLQINEGMFYENAIAQMLVANGHKLYFYTHYNENKHRNDMEIDFIISNNSRLKYKMFPIEVNLGKQYKTTSLNNFREKYKERIGESYIIHPRNLIVKDGIICIPPYMTMNI